MKGINLLEKSIVEEQDVKGVKRKATVYSVVLLIGFLVINTILFIYDQANTKKINQLKSTYQEKLTIITNLKSQEIKYHVLKEKLSFLSTIAKEKLNISTYISFFQDLEAAGLTYDGISFSSEKITLTGETATVEALSNVFSLLIEKDQGQKLFKKVSLGGLSLGKEGHFSFDLTLVPNI